MIARPEVAQALYRALARGDAHALAGLLDPEFTGRTADGLPLGLGGEYVGPRDMQENFWWRLGRHFRAEAQPEEYVDLPDGRLLVSGTYRGSGRRSGRKLEAAFTHVLTFREDRIVGLVQLTDTAAWFDALGEDQPLETIEYAVEGGVATVLLNRPQERNAINLRLAEEWLVVARRIAADPAVRAVLIAGSGDSLSVGGDINEFAAHVDGDLGLLFERMTTPFHEGFRILSRIDAPIVTAAHGAVAGGGLGFVYTADIVVAADDARFVTAFADLGVSGDGGGTWNLPRLIGPARATRVLLENRPISAAEALDWGLVSELVPASELGAHTRDLASRLATGPTRAVGHLRRLLRDGATNDLATQLHAETDALAQCGRTHDATAAIAAFLAKQRPTFEGR